MCYGVCIESEMIDHTHRMPSCFCCSNATHTQILHKVTITLLNYRDDTFSLHWNDDIPVAVVTAIQHTNENKKY